MNIEGAYWTEQGITFATASTTQLARIASAAGHSTWTARGAAQPPAMRTTASFEAQTLTELKICTPIILITGNGAVAFQSH
ncbi:unnamed protein product [Gongylonema pulchrum]|uniref:TPP_enzyme_N domain-containing protein n=1 Tax=Gongylonema pulchrum TaxID=637853 RepID=A0A183DTV7_9BILA|nr:unnamed protein product [Gongylonema pulchrum]